MAKPEKSPYVGLRPYAIDDAALFFGRERESWELTSLVLASRLVVVYGPSGVGKTSLLHAGVLAALTREGAAQVLPVGRPASTSSLPPASTEQNPLTLRLLSSWAPDEPEANLRERTIVQFLQGLPRETDRYGEELSLVAVVDRFEEVFSDLPLWSVHREDFLAQLGEAVETIDRLRLVLSLKEDAVGEVLPYESTLSRSNRTRFKVRPLDRAAALDAVTGPLRTTRRSFSPGVAEELVARLMTTTITNSLGVRRKVEIDAVEPISIQVVCSALWRALPDGVTRITRDHLKDHGDVDKTLGEFCAQAVAEVADRERVPEVQLWRWLEQAFVTDHGTRNVAYEGVDMTAGMPNAVARAFEQHRMLRAERRSRSVWFELLHDGLIEPIRAGHRRSMERESAGYAATRPGNYLQMAESALAYGMSPQAENLASQAIAASEDDPRTLAEVMSLLGKLVLARARTAEGGLADELYATAEQHYRRAAELFETEQNVRAVAEVLGSLGRLFRERRRFADALSVLQGAVMRMPGQIDLHLDLAQTLLDLGQPHAALAQYESLLRVDPESVDALLARATIKSEHGDPIAALADAERAVRLRPDLADHADVVAVRVRARDRLQPQAG
jgi:tetratricopeptide (TPR) repeat protein